MKLILGVLAALLGACTTVVMIDRMGGDNAKQNTEASKDDGGNRSRVEAPGKLGDQNPGERREGIQRR